MTVKTILKWLDTLTAWGFVVGLACQAYDLFMVQSPARFRVFGQGGDYGGFYGSITDNDPLPCMHDAGVWNQRTACRMVGGADLLANAYLDAYHNVSSYRIKLFYCIYNL